MKKLSLYRNTLRNCYVQIFKEITTYVKKKHCFTAKKNMKLSTRFRLEGTSIKTLISHSLLKRLAQNLPEMFNSLKIFFYSLRYVEEIYK